MRLIDCTLRDGGNLNNWKFSDSDISRLVGHLDAAGVDLIEVGYRGGSGSKRDTDSGKTANVPATLLNSLPRLTRAELAVMAIPKVCSPALLDDLVDTPVQWVRVAVYPQDAKLAYSFVSHLKRRGHHVGVNLMAATYATPAETIDIAKNAESAGADMFYIADSFGAMSPQQVDAYIRRLVDAVDIEIGFHGHNNLGLAFVNAFAARNAGATCLDTSLCGMARGAGNLVTEQVIASAGWLLDDRAVNLQDALCAAELVYKNYMAEAMPVRRREIECGLGNIHYYSYADFQAVAERFGVDRVHLMSAVSDSREVRASLDRIESTARLLTEAA
ncbi:aldolase [Burkholderia cenocepacia]|uniref:aldolase n=1 Tax=Burkholderia cenocepacia TaxID=95486 RepID=UPI000F5B94F7|nr:aldolase [Burkholderia cenocepacia]RQU98657.1 aldolase [Burkholderia cenocepacia]HDR9880360.1 aldolase [Burkholderia cenocepacia]HDR9887651.1 aldolase [Burkholderia cenocepacia]